MKTFITDIFPRLQRFSQRLDNISLLTNQHWVVLDELTQSKTVYIFLQDGELLISINGKVNKAKWSYVGQNSILIDTKDQSFLFRHGFFDDNILALKIDGKVEYAVLINETKYGSELNSISAVTDLLGHKYLSSSDVNSNVSGDQTVKIDNEKHKKDGYNFKMGFYKEYRIWFSNGKTAKIYYKESNGKYFIYGKHEIILFPDKETCLNYLCAKQQHR